MTIRLSPFAIPAILFALLLAPAQAGQTYSSDDPRFVVDTVLRLKDRHRLPEWHEPSFPKAMRPYLTPDLIAAVVHGADVATRKDLNLYDGEFFTGGQGVLRIRLFSAEIVKSGSNWADVSALVGGSDTNAPPKTGGRNTFKLKRIDGVWKIDDFKDDEPDPFNRPSVKTLFSNPEKYR